MRQLALFYKDKSVIECGFDDDEEVEVHLTFKVSKKYLEAPVHGLQAIVQSDPIRCRHVLRGEDHFYSLPAGMIHAADNLTPFLVEYLQGIVKFGVCLSDDEYRDVMARVKSYTRIPRNCKRTETEPDENVD